MSKITIATAAIVVLLTYVIDWPIYSFLAIFAMIVLFIALSNILASLGGWR